MSESCLYISRLKPDGGELFVSNFNSNNFSIVETGNNEVGGSYLIGDNPSQGIVTADNSLLYMSNFGSDTVSVYAIDEGRVAGAVQVGSHPDALALTPDEETSAGPGFGIGRRCGGTTVKTRDNSKISADRALVTLIPGRQSAKWHRDQGVHGREALVRIRASERFSRRFPSK